MPDITGQIPALRAAAELLEQNPKLPAPYVTSHGDGVTFVNWYINNTRASGCRRLSPEDQGTIALTIFDTLGGTWAESTIHTSDSEDRPIVHWAQERDGLVLVVQVHRPVLVEVAS